MTDSKSTQLDHVFDVIPTCQQVRRFLPIELMEQPDGDLPFGLYQHLSVCRSCLEVYIALQAAADLACPLPTVGLRS